MKKAALFIPCFVDQLLPEVGLDMARVLRRAGCDVDFFEEQTCCGQPAFNSGDWRDASPMAERFVRIFGTAESVVCPSGSCAAMVRRFYPELLEGTRAGEEARRLGERVFEFSEFLVRVMGVTEIGASFPHRVTYHDACHTLRELGIREEPRRLLAAVRGLTLVEMANAEECCGFGGTFSTKFPAISAAMGESKAAGAERAEAEFVTSTDPSCLLQIDGILRRRNSSVRAIHLASILARTEAGGVNSGERE